MNKWRLTTSMLHLDRKRADNPHRAMHAPIHNSVAFGYSDTSELADTFQGKREGFLYSRQGNPTVAALQDRITLMEQGESSLVFSTGMSAIGSAMLALCAKDDHLVSSQFLFGNTTSLFGTLAKYGLKQSFVDATDVGQVETALTPQTKIVFVETIANPRTQIADLEAIGELCQEHKILYIVDNTMTSPWLFQPATVGAGIVVNSLTKYIAGHGVALGGAITNTGLFNWEDFSGIEPAFRKGDSVRWGLTQIRKRGLRDVGATLSAHSAHDISVGTETLALRMNAACANAQALAKMLENHPKVQKVYYPGLKSHPQYERAQALFRYPGALLSFELKDDVDAFAFLNRLELVVRSTNLGDSRTLAIPVAHTIYHEMGPERRAQMGISNGLIRVSVGIEDRVDLLDDFDLALGQ